MRQFTITLAQNLGNGRPGEILDVTSARVDVGAWHWEADKELTKLSPGDITVRLADVDDAIWTWLQTQIQNGSDLLPPWLLIDTDGTGAFTGLCRPDLMKRDRDGEITLTAQDWSAQLSEKVLGALRPEDDLVAGANPWLRPSPVVAANRPASSTYQGQAALCLQLGIPALLDTVYFPEPANWVQVGDIIDAVTPSMTTNGAKVLEVRRNTNDGGYENTCAVRLSRSVWPTPTGSTPIANYLGSFTRRLSDMTVQDFYQVVRVGSESPCYRLYLDTVDGIAAGDQLKLLNTSKAQTWTSLQIDAEGCSVVTREEVKDIAVGDRVFFTDESRAQLVFEDARATIARAAAPFAVDFSRFTMPSLPVPVLVWLPLRPLAGDDLTSLKDLEVGMNTLRAFGTARAWEGTPETGWTRIAGSTPRADWTCQRLTAPGTLMPDERASKAPWMPRRNRFQSLLYRTLTTDQTADATWDPSASEAAPAFLVHDYLSATPRRLLVKQGGSVEIEPWNGSAWGTMVTTSWQGSAVKSASVFPGVPGALLAFTGAGLELAAAFPGPVSATCAVPAGASDAVLLTTPWGAYLVGSRGYGRVTYAAGALSLAWVQPMDQDLSTFIPTTFTGLDMDSLVVLGRFDLKDTEDPSKVTTETWMLRLKAQPSASDASGAVLWSERILEGAPILAGAVRDPSQSGRVIGHCGGRLWQVSKQLPTAYALERFKPTGMKASEMIEHVAQVLCAVVAPTPDGVLHLVSRQDESTPIALTIPACEVTETRAWEHRYTLIRVAGEAEDMFRDVPGLGEAAPKGGQVLEFTGHPFLWTLSGCEAMARVYHAWFSPVRRIQSRTWPWADPSLAAPWESLPPLARVRINGESTTWMVLSLQDKRTEGEAKVTLLEVF